MLACWSENPDDRPTFTKLAEEFSDILQGECGSVSTVVVYEQKAIRQRGEPTPYSAQSVGVLIVAGIGQGCGFKSRPFIILKT